MKITTNTMKGFDEGGSRSSLSALVIHSRERITMEISSEWPLGQESSLRSSLLF
ncbi:MAG TPA: hypothetical protein VFR94_16110 [Nitrososphaeraceae archaeon]|nr:hypothetical protein [Nitrososphaeraceae archaeon]